MEDSGDGYARSGSFSNGGDSAFYEKFLLEDLDSYWDDLNSRLTVSRMVNDSIIKGMVSGVVAEADEKIACLRERLRRLRVVVEEQLASVRRAESLAEVGDKLDCLEPLLDVVFENIDKMICSPEDEIEREVVDIVTRDSIRAMHAEFETKLYEQREISSQLSMNWQTTLDQLSDVREELDAISRSFSTETGSLLSYHSIERKFLNNGQQLILSLDHYSGSGFQSKNQYLFGTIDMQIKLVPGNSAGTVTTFYLSSQGPTHDEIDFEFLGNVTGQPYIIHTNVFAQGKGNREQQFYLWFDPTKAFHTYSILWNPQNIIFSVDGTPLRVFKNHEANNVAFPNKQAMRMYSSLWDAEDWATRGGLVKTDWSKAPFVASYQGYSAQACVWSSGTSTCGSTAGSSNPWFKQGLDSVSQARLAWVQKNYMIYNYCTDVKRFPQGLPRECSLP